MISTDGRNSWSHQYIETADKNISYLHLILIYIYTTYIYISNSWSQQCFDCGYDTSPAQGPLQNKQLIRHSKRPESPRTMRRTILRSILSKVDSAEVQLRSWSPTEREKQNINHSTSLVEFLIEYGFIGRSARQV